MQHDLIKRGRESASAAETCRPVLIVLLFVLALAVPSVQAVEMTSLYTVEVPLDPDDPDAESSAFRTALTEVLIRVTGTTAAADSEELALLFPNPRRLVRQYRPGPDNTLVISLDGDEIERVLRQMGTTVWGSDRPLTIIWLAVDWGLGDREIVAADDPDRLPGDRRSIDRNRLLRERVKTVARRRGLPIVFPLLDIEDLQKIGFIDIWGGFDDPLLEASARYEATSILVGRIRPDDIQQPRWTWYVADQRFAWPGEPEEAINQLADALASRDAIRGDQEVETIELTISGINSVPAFGQVQRYLENLRVVDNLMISSAASDRITYSVEVQGGSERLNSVLALSRFLERADDEYFIDDNSFGMDRKQNNRSLEYQYLPGPPTTQGGEVDLIPGPDPEN